MHPPQEGRNELRIIVSFLFLGVCKDGKSLFFGKELHILSLSIVYTPNFCRVSSGNFRRRSLLQV
jgi:hypothetical protein